MSENRIETQPDAILRDKSMISDYLFFSRKSYFFSFFLCSLSLSLFYFSSKSKLYINLYSMAAPKIQNDFPLEVLHRIFDKLPFQRKITCQKVCKAGSKVALASCKVSGNPWSHSSPLYRMEASSTSRQQQRKQQQWFKDIFWCCCQEVNYTKVAGWIVPTRNTNQSMKHLWSSF